MLTGSRFRTMCYASLIQPMSSDLSTLETSFIFSSPPSHVSVPSTFSIKILHTFRARACCLFSTSSVFICCLTACGDMILQLSRIYSFILPVTPKHILEHPVRTINLPVPSCDTSYRRIDHWRKYTILCNFLTFFFLDSSQEEQSSKVNDIK